MLKVIWLCNVAFSDRKTVATGTWLQSMADTLIDTGTIQLYNISQGRVNDATRQDYRSICQWLIPSEPLKKNGLPSSYTIQKIQKIVEAINPDIIHIWGTENYWGLLSARGYINGKIILEIQGFKFAIEKYFYCGLSFIDLLKCFGLKELLKPSVSLVGQKNSFKRWGKFEKEMLIKNSIISTQSNWVRAHVKNVNPFAQILNTSISLRPVFIHADKWEMDNCVPHQVFTLTSSIDSYKGLHILTDSIAILKKQHPQIRLVIACNIQHGIRQSGYSKWLMNRIKSVGIYENVTWLGPLDAKNLVLEMYKANVFVVPSFVESYCLVLDEALTVGVPTVASFAGAMPELATHEKSALYFPPGDAIMCAFAINKLFMDNNYATELSLNSYKEKRVENNTNIALAQLATYRKIADEDYLDPK